MPGCRCRPNSTYTSRPAKDSATQWPGSWCFLQPGRLALRSRRAQPPNRRLPALPVTRAGRDTLSGLSRRLGASHVMVVENAEEPFQLNRQANWYMVQVVKDLTTCKPVE